ncbi:MAG: hypothetical protein IJ269_06835, partial [Bacteroidales bacterium]|nr:hypothetical protein [Bacteroidales bacterium]
MKTTKLYAPLLLAVLFTAPSMAQYTAEYYRLKGKVKKVSTQVYTNYDELPIHNNTIEFDTMGRLTSQLENANHMAYHYSSTASLPDTISTSNNKTIAIEYNHLNQKIAETEYIDNTAIKKVEITYDTSTNSQYQTIIALPEGRKTKEIISIYDQDGCKIKECTYTFDTLFNEDKTLQKSISYIYDMESNLLQYIQYTYNDEGVDTRTVGNYNKHGKLKNETSYTADDFPFRTTKIDYDKRGNITKKTITFAEYDEVIKTSYSYKYQYDKQGNWTFMTFMYNGKEY